MRNNKLDFVNADFYFILLRQNKSECYNILGKLIGLLFAFLSALNLSLDALNNIWEVGGLIKINPYILSGLWTLLRLEPS